MSAPATDAVAAWHNLLEDEFLAAESSGTLQGGQGERNLFFGRHPLCTALRPNLLTAQRFAAVTAAAHGVADACATLQQALLADADLRTELDLDPVEEELALAEPGATHPSPSSRLDGFFADQLRFVEYNAETPAGIAYGDNLSEVFDHLPVTKEFRKAWRIRPLPVRQRQLDAMLRAFREWAASAGRTGERPRMAIVDWPNLPTHTEFVMFQQFFEAAGVPTLITVPDALEFRDGRLWADGEEVNLVYRRLLTTEMIASGSPGYVALRDGYLAGGFCSVNTFRAKLLDKKMSLALLSDEQYAGLYSAEQRRAIAAHVPWTRKVRGGPTTRHGLDIPDLLAYLQVHRNELVLKPNDEYGGKGVVLGWTVDAAEWEQSLIVAETQSYVVQEAVPAPKEPFPVALGEEVRLLDLTVDLDPYLFYGEVGGVLTRLSSSALLNVTAGTGSVVPTFVVDGPA